MSKEQKILLKKCILYKSNKILIIDIFLLNTLF